MRKLLLILWSVAAWSATTTVQQAIIGPDGQPASGTVNIRITAPCVSGTDYVGAKTISRAFAGVLTVKLVPNDSCSPSGTSYTVGWTFSDGRALGWMAAHHEEQRRLTGHVPIVRSAAVGLTYSAAK